MKEYLDRSLRRYINDTSARISTPGGGSVAALTATLAVSLVCMVLQFSNKHQKTKILLEGAHDLKKKLIKLIDADISAYKKVKDAYTKSAKTERQRQLRNNAIQKALLKAIRIPEEVSNLSFEGLKTTKKLLKVGNLSLISDTAIAAVLFHAAYHSAIYNIKINLKYLKDKDLVRGFKKQDKLKSKRVERLKERITKEIEKAL